MEWKKEKKKKNTHKTQTKIVLEPEICVGIANASEWEVGGGRREGLVEELEIEPISDNESR